MKETRFFLILFCALIIYCRGSEIENLIAEELKLIFGTNNVPNYEIVSTAYTTQEYKPNTTEVRVLQITSFKRDIRLYLEPVHGYLAGKNTPVYVSQADSESPLGIRYTRISNAMDDMVQLYQDVYNNAAITTRPNKDGKIDFEGMIGNNLMLRQVPPGLRDKLPRYKRSSSPSNSSPRTERLRYNDQHILVEIADVGDVACREKNGSYTGDAQLTRLKRQINVPATIYPQVLVVVDYDMYLSFQTFIDFKHYVLSFWNAVDLRYRVFVNPNVRINIAGIVVPTDPGGIPYISEHLSRSSKNVSRVDADEALDQAGKYFFNETNGAAQRFVLTDNYDAIMIMTKSDLCNRVKTRRSYRFDCTTLGYSYRGGACTMNINESLVEAVGLVEDNAKYAGILPAAHELGHLLGVPHDGHEEPNKTTCPPNDGYIMSHRLMFGENTFAWSYCSAEYIKQFFHSPRAECLFNQPIIDAKLSRLLPGTILSLDEQCDQSQGSYACNRDSSACVRLDCYSRKTDTCIPIAPAAEGSQCGYSSYCINGRCVDVYETSKVNLEIALPPAGAK